jgi:hypothetical protein
MVPATGNSMDSKLAVIRLSALNAPAWAESHSGLVSTWLFRFLSRVGVGIVGHGFSRFHDDAPGLEQRFGYRASGAHTRIVHQGKGVGKNNGVAAAQNVLIHGKGQGVGLFLG